MCKYMHVQTHRNTNMLLIIKITYKLKVTFYTFLLAFMQGIAIDFSTFYGVGQYISLISKHTLQLLYFSTYHILTFFY